MLYDLPHPQPIVHDIAAALSDNGLWHTEQGHMPGRLLANAYDTACQEQLEYYRQTQLKWMADLARLKMWDCR